MLALRIIAWNHAAGHFAGEPKPKNDKVFDQLLEDQELVANLQRQFNKLERGVVSFSIILDGYRYQFSFFQGDVVTQTYTGQTNVAMWTVEESGERQHVDSPRAVLSALHESIGLPV
jgi:hypothetical protein